MVANALVLPLLATTVLLLPPPALAERGVQGCELAIVGAGPGGVYTA